MILTLLQMLSESSFILFFNPLNPYIFLILNISWNYIRVHLWPKVKFHFLFSSVCLSFSPHSVPSG